jgi:hypothetical protein
MKRNQNYPQEKKQQNLTGQTTPQRRTTSYNHEPTPWSRSYSSHENQIAPLKWWQRWRLLQNPHRTRTQRMTDYAELFNFSHLSPPAPILPLVKPETHSCTLRMDQGLILPVHVMWPRHKINLLHCLSYWGSDQIQAVGTPEVEFCLELLVTSPATKTGGPDSAGIPWENVYLVQNHSSWEQAWRSKGKSH